jgi:integrase
VLNRASNEYKIDSGYMNIRVLGEDAPTVYLTIAEIEKLIKLRDISKRAAIIRDYFVLMCMTGLRLSDARRLTSGNILNGYLSIKTQKTRQVVQIPIHPFVRNILNKWSNKIPKCSTQQAFYKTLQRLCRYAGIVDEILIERTVGTKIERKVYKKYSLVTPHTGRRSFATNAYLSGITTARIMMLTGHSTEQSFFRYIRISRHENAVKLSHHPFFN